MTSVQVTSWRTQLRHFVDHDFVQRAMIGAILLNAVVFGLETIPSVMEAIGPLLLTADRILLVLFVVEIVLRLIAHGGRFFRDAWSVFDLAVVGIGLLPATESLTALRALRVLRLLRLITLVPRLRAVVAGLLAAIPGMFAISGLLLLLFYVSAVIATKLFAAAAPQWFGALPVTMFTLFQIMTLEGWADIAKGVMVQLPWAWLFFVPFILVTTFTMLNLFIAVIVGALESERHEPAPAAAGNDQTVERLEAMSRELAALAAAARNRR